MLLLAISINFIQYRIISNALLVSLLVSLIFIVIFINHLNSLSETSQSSSGHQFFGRHWHPARCLTGSEAEHASPHPIYRRIIYRLIGCAKGMCPPLERTRSERKRRFSTFCRGVRSDVFYSRPAHRNRSNPPSLPPRTASDREDNPDTTPADLLPRYEHGRATNGSGTR